MQRRYEGGKHGFIGLFDVFDENQRNETETGQPCDCFPCPFLVPAVTIQ
jgi:hypothetical protein